MDKPSNYRGTRQRQSRLRKLPPTAWFAGRAELTWSELIVDDTFPSLLEVAAGVGGAVERQRKVHQESKERILARMSLVILRVVFSGGIFYGYHRFL